MKIPFVDLARAYAEQAPMLNKALKKTLASCRYILGPEVEAFENDFARYCGARHAVGVASGLDALTLALRAWDIGPGDEVIVPSHTFIATWLAVSQTGARIVPVEPDEATLTIDPARVEKALSKRTKAIIVVHLYGLPCDMDPIRRLARKRGIRVLEDAAQAHGAFYKGRRAGTLGDAAAFSFYPTKNLGAAGDGGILTTHDAVLAAKLRQLRNYGSTIKYHHDRLGVNSRLDTLQAAFLRVRLRTLDRDNARRAKSAALYRRGLSAVPGVLTQTVPDWARPVWHLFTIRTIRRDALAAFLASKGIATMVHYPIPPHRTGAYRDAFGDKRYPIAEAMAGSLLSLPMHPYLTADQVDAVCRAIAEFSHKG